jgi:hypothetical protein
VSKGAICFDNFFSKRFNAANIFFSNSCPIDKKLIMFAPSLGVPIATKLLES